MYNGRKTPERCCNTAKHLKGAAWKIQIMNSLNSNRQTNPISRRDMAIITTDGYYSHTRSFLDDVYFWPHKARVLIILEDVYYFWPQKARALIILEDVYF